MKANTGSRGRRCMASAGITLIVAVMIAGMAGCLPEPIPVPSSNLEIRTWYDLDEVRYNLSGHHRLMNSLNATTPGYDQLAGPTANWGEGWKPIGEPYPPGPYRPFRGTFDGQGYEISDLYINPSSGSQVGLFTALDSGVIENLGVVNARVTGKYCVGGLVGEVEGTIKNSYFVGNVTGDGHVGGLVGLLLPGSIVSNSYYNYDRVLIRGQNVITIGALHEDEFEEWLTNGRSLDVNDKLTQENGYYLVSNITDFRQLLAFGQDDSLAFRLENDLDLTAHPNLYIPCLAGEFHGDGHRISNLSFSFDFVSRVGLFGYLTPGAKVSDLGVENVTITGDESIGGLVGLNKLGTVSNSYSTGSVTGYRHVGGLVGSSEQGTLSHSYSTASVTGYGSVVGGLVGGSDYLAGRSDNPSTISNCHFSGSVNGNGIIGGLLGFNCNDGVVRKSYSTGTVSGTTEVGGLVGYNTGDCAISDSYSSCDVTGELYVGGLVGANSWQATVSNSYSTGSVTGDGYVGGLVGRNTATVHSGYWDTETSGQATSDGGIGKTTTEMQNIAAFVGWNIVAVGQGEVNTGHTWNIVNGVSYPFLSWQE
jgi:hypothetical protein